MSEIDWLGSLKEGDEVCYYSRYHGYIVTKVEKVTPTGQVKTVDKRTFKKGICRVDSRDSYTLQPVTKKIRRHLRRVFLLSEIERFKFRELGDDDLENIYQVLRGGQENAQDTP